MILTVLSSFLSGIGATFGVLVAIAIIIGIGALIKMYLSLRDGKKNLPQILLSYRKTLLQRDMFEEYVFISKFVKDLKKNIVPKELSEKYILDVDWQLGWTSTMDGNEKLGLTPTYRIIPKVSFIKKKEENKKDENKSK